MGRLKPACLIAQLDLPLRHDPSPSVSDICDRTESAISATTASTRSASIPSTIIFLVPNLLRRLSASRRRALGLSEKSPAAPYRRRRNICDSFPLAPPFCPKVTLSSVPRSSQFQL